MPPPSGRNKTFWRRWHRKTRRFSCACWRSLWPDMSSPAAAQTENSVRLVGQLEMLHHRWGSEERSHDGAPLGEQGGLAETHGVVFQRVPEDLQHIALGILNAVVDLGATVALGAHRHGGQATGNGFFEGGLLAGLDADVGEFEDHGGSVAARFASRVGAVMQVSSK